MDLPVMRFGGFEANLRTRELWRQGVRVHLQDQPFQILAMMLERPGDIVTCEEICGRLWPDGTNVDFEHSVNAAIKRLRAALGDTADSPRFVETLPRRGYRFIAPVVDSTLGTSAQVAGNALPRMVVLPFEDLSHERANDYFSDGLTEEMISQLGRLLGTRIRVIARTSSMLLKGTRQTVSDIGKAFGASYLMEGSVRRDGDRLASRLS
jgi:DNA-binding winged helix-turn-helix (wHTH) protein